MFQCHNLLSLLSLQNGLLPDMVMRSRLGVMRDGLITSQPRAIQHLEERAARLHPGEEEKTRNTERVCVLHLQHEDRSQGHNRKGAVGDFRGMTRREKKCCR